RQAGLHVADRVGEEHDFVGVGEPGRGRFLVVGRAAPATGDAGVFEEPLQRGVLVGRDVTGEDVGEAVGQVVGEEDTAYGLHRVGRKDGQRVRAGEVVDDAGHAGHEVGTVSVAQAALE